MKIKKTRNKRITFKKILKFFFLGLLFFLIGFTIYFFQAIKLDTPEISDLSPLEENRIQIDENFYGIKNNRLRKSETGLWELFVEGNAFERGVYNGKLTEELAYKQEDAFVEQIKKMIPSEGFLKFLKYMTSWFNRNMDDYVPEEYLKEIYGISFSASNEFEFIGANYDRILNYHAAHDIGHALQNLAKVGCTSFSCKDENSEDGQLIIGRNFDFYVGDKFAEDKIVTFYKPDEGYKFAMITWGGFTGVVSGMNDQGLTVTLNAAKSEIPFSSAVPISIIAREILQYASTIDEAYSIAKKRKAFVAEAIMIGSANDRSTGIIEITPHSCSLYNPKNDLVIGPNHFQSEELKNSVLNLENIKESSSMYRFKRINQLIKENSKLNIDKAVAVLRNKDGINDKNIGMGNEKNICQLISHHSIIFKPEELRFWISTNPYQLGKFVCYDLDSVFSEFPGMNVNHEIYIDEFSVPEDSFLYSKQFVKFKNYKNSVDILKKAIKDENFSIKDDIEIPELINSNSEYFYVYQLAGDYYFEKENFEEAKHFYLLALIKEITTLTEKNTIEEQLKEIEKILSE